MQEDKLIELARSIKNPENKYNGNELYYIAQVLDWENYQDETPFAIRLEKAFAKRFGVKYGIAHNSGTGTLQSCLAAGGIGAGDEVLLPAQSVLMNTATTLHQNAIPVFVDIDENTFNIDPIDIEKKITNKTKAIQVVHMHGLPADMDPIMKIAKRYNLFVIEDSAQCVLGQYKDKFAGTIGHMASWSFETKKHLSTGEGGMITTDDSSLATKARKNGFNGYRAVAADAPLAKKLPEEFQDPSYRRHDTLGYNYRMNEITAAMALAQLERIDEIVKKRQDCASYFIDEIGDCSWLRPQLVKENITNSYYTFSARYLGESEVGMSWKSFWNEYKKIGGDGFYGAVAVSYQEPMVKNEVYFKTGYLPRENKCTYNQSFKYFDGMCPVAELVQSQIMSFKTNYRNLEAAKRQAKLLGQLIKSLKS
tara:strand:- start:70 stop:1335 length:1266 start_codon:yes stop_codon:yes gene_type:complete